LEDALRALLHAGQQAFSAVPLAATDFVAHLAEHLAAEHAGPLEVGPGLLVGSDGEPPRIGEYAGRGALQGWLRISAVRVALRLSRKRVVDGQVAEGGGGMDALVEPALGP
jgi:hypothetical protein